MATALQTTRLVIRPFSQQDFDCFVAEMLTDPRVVEFYYSFRDEVDMDRIRQQAKDDFRDQFEESPEFVILFIPGDQFRSAALGEEPDLIEYALSQQIILATPTSLVALLKAVAYGWRQLALADNAKEIRILAEDLYGRLGTFVTHMNRMGRQLASSVENYNRAVGSLERSAERSQLAARGKRSLENVAPAPSMTPSSRVTPVQT